MLPVHPPPEPIPPQLSQAFVLGVGGAGGGVGSPHTHCLPGPCCPLRPSHSPHGLTAQQEESKILSSTKPNTTLSRDHYIARLGQGKKRGGVRWEREEELSHLPMEGNQVPGLALKSQAQRQGLMVKDKPPYLNLSHGKTLQAPNPTKLL